MSKLAILGHATRGKEVIEILEMLGGVNKYKVTFTETHLIYCLREGDSVIIATYPNTSITNIFTIERFLEKFSYKVGDKVLINADINDVYTIKSMKWDTDLDRVAYTIEAIDGIVDNHFWFADEMEQYLEQKEETMENKPDLLQQLKDYFDNTPREVVEKEWHEYDKYNEIGPTIDEYLEYVNKIRQPKYPKTYVECAKILDCFGAAHIDGYKGELLDKFQELLICRDAYWKIAGDEMGLGKPWKPDWSKADERKYCIVNTEGNIKKWVQKTTNKILAFPTEEIRDTFKENFKDLIEDCKELL